MLRARDYLLPGRFAAGGYITGQSWDCRPCIAVQRWRIGYIEVIVNALVVSYAEAVLAIRLVSVLFVLAVRKELVARVRAAVAWLLKVSFFDFVHMLIFIKPWKQYSQRI